MNNIQRDALAWAQAKPFLDEMRQYSNVLKVHDMRVIRARALVGDIPGARKMLVSVLNRREEMR